VANKANAYYGSVRWLRTAIETRGGQCGKNPKVVQSSAQDQIEKNLPFNPHAYTNPSHKQSWPRARGFPVDQLQKNFQAWD